jgi:hypothetical protein
VSLIYFILAAFGMTQILVYGSVFNNIRPTRGKLGELFNCSMCVGFWVGIFLFGINGFTELFTFDYNFINALVMGCLSSGTSYILNEVFGDCGLKIQLNGEKNENYTS